MHNHQSTFKNWSVNPPGEGFLGRKNFCLMVTHMLIRLNMVELNERLGKYVTPGRYISLDEKHKGCQKDKHLSRVDSWEKAELGLLDF